MEQIFNVSSVEETWRLAADFAERLKPGDVVCLEGDLGAGKTTFTQGLAAHIGAKRAVTSPTFCLVAEHPSPRFLLVHMDLYRLAGADDVLAIGWEDYLARGAVMLVEWSCRAEELIPADAWHIRFSLVESNADARTISISHID